MQLDVKEFYASFNEDILTNAIQFPKLHTTTDDKDFHLIIHCRKSLLFFRNETWKKNQQKVALMLPWAALMVLRYASL